MDKTFILKENSVEIRRKIRESGIYVCPCAEFVDADWLDFHTSVNNGVHGNGYPFEGMTKEETRALFLYEVKNPVWCENVDEFINEIKKWYDEQGEMAVND
jgi:hypothetical protein